MKNSILVRSVLLTAVCLLASKATSNAQNLFNLTVPNYSFEDTTSPIVVRGNFPYSDQYQASYNSFPTVVMFNGWEVASHQGGNLYQYVSTAGDTGTFQGSLAATTYSGGAYFESLNPITTIANNATYTLTFAISGAGGTTYNLLATSQGADPNFYVSNPGSGYVPTLSPNPLIQTLGTLASGTSSGAAAGTYVDVTSISFNTLHGNNAAFVGDNLSLFVGLAPNASFDNVRVTELALVPEPSTWALLLAGVAGLFIVGRRKLKA